MPDGKIRIALVSVDASTRSALEQMDLPMGTSLDVVHEERAPIGSLNGDQAAAMRKGKAEIALLDFSADPSAGVELAQRLSDAMPSLHLIATGPDLVPDVLLKAMRAGISEYMPRPVSPEELASAMGRVSRRRASAGQKEGKVGQVFAFLPVKGGTGTTTAATNLAIALQQRTGEKTVLVDLDLEMGGVALLLGIRPRFSFLDIARNFHRLDEGLISSYVERHETGLEVLAAPLRPERSDVITAEEAGRIIAFLRRVYTNVVIDMSKSLSPMTLSVLENADMIVAVTTADLPTLGSLKRLMPVLERIGPNSLDRLRVALNRYHPDGTVTLDDVRALLETDVNWTLSNDYKAVIKAANEGEPIALNERSPYARDIAAMAGDLAEVEAEEGDYSDNSGLVGSVRRLFGRKSNK